MPHFMLFDMSTLSKADLADLWTVPSKVMWILKIRKYVLMLTAVFIFAHTENSTFAA